MKTKYEVKIIQDGIPFYVPEKETIKGVCFDKKMVTTIGIFNSLHYAQIMRDALKKEIAKSNDYLYQKYAPQVEIYEVRTVKEILNL